MVFDESLIWLDPKEAKGQGGMLTLYDYQLYNYGLIRDTR